MCMNPSVQDGDSIACTIGSLSNTGGFFMLTTEQRFWSKVDKSGECWIWTAGKTSKGYGKFTHSRSNRAHRWAYEQVNGPIPEGLVIDHLCRTPACVNPNHLEAVTPRVNILRGIGSAAQYAKQTHCKHGHEYTPDNTHIRVDGARECRICQRASNAKFRRVHGRWGKAH